MMTMMFTTMMMITLFFCIGVVRMILVISTVVTAITAIAKCFILNVMRLKFSENYVPYKCSHTSAAFVGIQQPLMGSVCPLSFLRGHLKGNHDFKLAKPRLPNSPCLSLLQCSHPRKRLAPYTTSETYAVKP